MRSSLELWDLLTRTLLGCWETHPPQQCNGSPALRAAQMEGLLPPSRREPLTTAAKPCQTPSPASFFWKCSSPGQFLLQFLLCRAGTTNCSCVQHFTSPSQEWDTESYSSTWVRSRTTEVLLWGQGSCWKHHPLWYQVQTILVCFCSVLTTNVFSRTF